MNNITRSELSIRQDAPRHASIIAGIVGGICHLTIITGVLGIATTFAFGRLDATEPMTALGRVFLKIAEYTVLALGLPFVTTMHYLPAHLRLPGGVQIVCMLANSGLWGLGTAILWSRRRSRKSSD